MADQPSGGHISLGARIRFRLGVLVAHVEQGVFTAHALSYPTNPVKQPAARPRTPPLKAP